MLIIIGLTSSCSFPHYRLENKYQPTTIDFSYGKWIMNTIKIPNNVSNNVEPKLLHTFSNALNDGFVYYLTSSNIMLPRNISMELSQTELKEIKQLYGFDFFIQVKEGILKEDLGFIIGKISKKSKKSKKSNTSYAQLNIYDISNLTLIYSQKVTGEVSRTTDNDDVHFTKTSKEILIKSFDKLNNDMHLKTVN